MGWLYLSTTRNLKLIHKNLRKIGRQVFTSPLQIHYEVPSAGFVNPHTWLEADKDSRQSESNPSSVLLPLHTSKQQL